jgi:hypothetical protein
MLGDRAQSGSFPLPCLLVNEFEHFKADGCDQAVAYSIIHVLSVGSILLAA